MKKIVYLLLLVFCHVTTNAQNDVTGTWSPIYDADMIPVACSNMPDGRILAWSAFDRYNFGGDNGQTYTSIFNPADNSFTTTLMANTGHDMFCPGTANIGTGELVVTGGSSSPKTTIYDPASNTFRAGPEMNTPRGYHAMATLSDGRVFTVGGSWSGGQFNKKAEVWSETTGWITLENVDSDQTVRQGAPDPVGIYRDDNHAWLMAAPNGRVFQAGPGTNMHWINTNGQGSIEDAGLRGDDPYAMNGTAVMYDAGLILKAGGAETYGESTPASNKTYIIDIRNGGANVNTASNLNNARAMHHSVVLPDGKVMVVGGLCKSVIFSDECASLKGEIWNPDTGVWTETADMQTPRTYHSVGILMKDGRVWLAGGGLCGACEVNHPDAEIYSPPYLFNGNSLATRPVINAAPGTAGYNSNITVSTNTSVQDFVLMRLSSSTHSVNTEQRRIPLTFSNNGANNYTLNIPNNDWLPPGNYFLFALKDGVPSIAETIKIGASGGGGGQQIVANGTYYIESLPTGQHVASPAFDGDNVRMIDQGTSDDQKWEITHINNNVYTLKNLRTNKYLNVFQSGCFNGANIIAWTNPNGDNSKWVISKVGAEYFFQPVHCSSHALDNGGGTNNSAHAWAYSTGNNNQRFILKSAGDGGGGGGNGLSATYYNNIDFTGSTITRIDPVIDFNWGQGSPDPAIGSDTYSARWEGFVETPASGIYTFFTTTDDGVRLWVNNQLIIDKWINQGATEWSGTITMTAGQKIPIKMEYYENGGGARAQLRWQGPGVSKQIIPATNLFANSDGEGGECNIGNVALGKNATQSSNYNGTFTADKANDNNTDASSMSHTQNDTNAWWEVDLEAVYDIKTIKVVNRKSCCQERLSDFHVFVSDVPFSSKNLNTTINQSGVSDYFFGGPTGDKRKFDVNRTGRYVRVQLSGTNYLHLTEVKVNGCINNNQRIDLTAESDLRATPIFGQQTQLNWYITQAENKQATQYTFQHYHEEYEDFEDIDVVAATDYIGLEQYDFIHKNPKLGKNYYQVKVGFEDGSVEYSNFKLVVFEPDAAEINIAPNPAQEKLRIDLANYMDEPIHYFIISITGEVILHDSYKQNHSEIEAIDLTDFPNGTYIIYLRPSQGIEIAKKFVVLKNR